MTVDELAQRDGLPPRYLRVVLVQLRRAGILATRRGRGAGYRFVGGPDTVTAAAVVRAVDGLLAEVPEFRAGTAAGASAADSAPRRLWSAVQARVEEVLEAVTIRDLVASEALGVAREAPGAGDSRGQPPSTSS